MRCSGNDWDTPKADIADNPAKPRPDSVRHSVSQFHAMTDFALVTKSYAGDFDLCRMLCESIDRHMPETKHYLLVDLVDAELFDGLKQRNREIVTSDNLLPNLKPFGVLGRRLWWKPPTAIVRGWIYQQLTKLAFVASMSEAAAVHLDSDLLLLGPISQDHVFANGGARLLRNPGGGQSVQHKRWHAISQRLLGLTQTGYSGVDYIGPGVIWEPRRVEAMLHRIETVTGKEWISALASQFRFSEYLLYGIFCDQISPNDAPTPPDGDWSSCHMSWHYDLTSSAGVDSFVQGVKPSHETMLIQSNLGLPFATRKLIVERVSERLEQQGA